MCSSGFGASLIHHLSKAVENSNSSVALADDISNETLLQSSPSQSELSNKLDDHLFISIFSSALLPDKACLLSISASQAASWLSVTPSEGLGLHLDPPIFQAVNKWWLGIDTSKGSPCALCPDSVLDLYGHHTITCKRGGDVLSRHNNSSEMLLLKPVDELILE